MRPISFSRSHLALALSVTAVSPACGSSSETRKVVASDAGPDANTTVRGTGGSSATGGHPNTGGGGTSSAGGASGSPATGGSLSHISDAQSPADTGTPDNGKDASAVQDASSTTAIEAGVPLPNIDGGPGCLPPTIHTALSPSQAGIPSAGLVLWLRADRGVYMTPTNRVCAWVDQSHVGSVFRDAGAGQPLWVDASVAGQAGIQFSPQSGPMTVGGVLGIPPTSGRTFVAVVKLVDTAARFQAVMQGRGSTPGTYVNLDANTFSTVGSREGVYATNNGYDSNLTTSTAPRIHIYTVATLTPGANVLSSIDYRVNDSALTLTRTSGGLGNGLMEDFSGANFTLVGNDGAAILAEALIYDHALSAGERTEVETALEGRYGIVP